MTSELDELFGPREEVEMPTAKPTHFGRYPEVQELCDAFLEEMEWGHDLYTIGQVAAGARDYVLAVNHDPALLIRATRKMKKEKMSIGSPRSCVTFAREMMNTPDPDSEAGRRKYETDFWEDDDETG